MLETINKSSKMKFVNRIASKEDILLCQLPFPKDGTAWWTVNTERSCYLWGGIKGNLAVEKDLRGIFYFTINGTRLTFTLIPGPGSTDFKDKPYVVTWDSIESVEPGDYSGLDINHVNSLLKEALNAYGRNGRDNKYTPVINVKFGF